MIRVHLWEENFSSAMIVCSCQNICPKGTYSVCSNISHELSTFVQVSVTRYPRESAKTTARLRELIGDSGRHDRNSQAQSAGLISADSPDRNKSSIEDLATGHNEYSLRSPSKILSADFNGSHYCKMYLVWLDVDRYGDKRQAITLREHKMSQGSGCGKSSDRAQRGTP